MSYVIAVIGTITVHRTIHVINDTQLLKLHYYCLYHNKNTENAK